MKGNRGTTRIANKSRSISITRKRRDGVLYFTHQAQEPIHFVRFYLLSPYTSSLQKPKQKYLFPQSHSLIA